MRGARSVLFMALGLLALAAVYAMRLVEPGGQR